MKRSDAIAKLIAAGYTPAEAAAALDGARAAPKPPPEAAPTAEKPRAAPKAKAPSLRGKSPRDGEHETESMPGPRSAPETIDLLDAATSPAWGARDQAAWMKSHLDTGNRAVAAALAPAPAPPVRMGPPGGLGIAVLHGPAVAGWAADNLVDPAYKDEMDGAFVDARARAAREREAATRRPVSAAESSRRIGAIVAPEADILDAATGPVNYAGRPLDEAAIARGKIAQQKVLKDAKVQAAKSYLRQQGVDEDALDGNTDDEVMQAAGELGYQ